MEVWLIAALDRNRVIGRRDTNQIPWHLPGDLRHFREVTDHRVIVMGRKTHASIGRRLPNRINLVLSRNPDYKASEGCIVMPSVDAVFEFVSKLSSPSLCVIGGSAVYEAFLSYATRLFLTRVHLESEGDVRFPDVDMSAWHCVSQTKKKDSATGVAYTFEEYTRLT